MSAPTELEQAEQDVERERDRARRAMSKLESEVSRQCSGGDYSTKDLAWAHDVAVSAIANLHQTERVLGLIKRLAAS